MDYAYLHNHHHQNHHQFLHQDHQLPVILSPPPSLANNINCSIQNSLSSSCYGDSTTTWTPNSNTIGGSCLSSLLLYPNNTLSSSVNHPQQQQEEVNMTTQELTFNHWPEEAAFSGGAMKQELSPAADQQFFCSTNGKRGGSTGSRFISQIYPTINVPSLNHNNNQELEEAAAVNSLGNSRSLGMNNLQALDLFNSEHHQQFGFQSFPGIDHYHHNLQQATHQRTLFGNNFHNISAALSCNNNATAEAKRQGNGVEPKPPQAPLIKKSRLDPRVSCPPFKVRKEKLGDRIAALQQLVAPFGKTDTASVLMEAIGYIKFLQNQVETLSVPYMKSSRNKGRGTTMQGWGQHEDNIETEETRRRGDLRSQGLCLVPLSCMSYVDDSCGSGGGFWPPQNFGGS